MENEYLALANKGDVTTIIGGDVPIVDYGDTKGRFKFTLLSERVPGQSWQLLGYGPSKSGKTYFGGTCGPRTLFINTGDGIETLLSPLFRSKYPDSKNMIVVDIREKNPNGIAEGFDLTAEAIDHALKHFSDRFDTVVLDEATALRKYALNKAIEYSNSERTKIRMNRTTEFVKADVGDFGIEMDMIQWFLGTYVPIFKEHNKNFVMLAHERQVFTKPPKVGDEPVLKRILPGFTGKTFPDQIPQFFDDVWRFEVVGAGQNRVYRAQTAGSEMEVAGVRHGGIFAPIEKNPNFLEMLARIKAGKLLTPSR